MEKKLSTVVLLLALPASLCAQPALRSLNALVPKLELKAVPIKAARIVAAPSVKDEVAKRYKRNRDELIDAISSHARSHNNFDEDLALRRLHSVAGLADHQADVMLTLFFSSTYENNFDEDQAFRMMFRRPQIDEVHAAVLKVLAKEARYENDFDEERAFAAVLNTRRIDPESAVRAVRIFRRARYGNGIDDTELFIEVLRS